MSFFPGSAPTARVFLTLVLLTARAKAQVPAQPPARPSASWISDPDDVLTWQLYDGAGWRAIAKGFYDTAEHEFQAAAQLAERIEPASDRRLMARSYVGLAAALGLQGRNAEAEPLVRWALAVREARGGPNTAFVATTWGVLASIETNLGKTAEAEAALRRALDVHASLDQPDQVDTAQFLASLGRLLAGQRRYAEAEPLFGRAAVIRQALLGESHPATVDAVAGLGSVLFEQGKDDEALPLLVQALTALEQNHGRKHNSLVAPLLAIADIQGHRGENVEAEAGYRRALALLEADDPTGGRAQLAAIRRFATWLDRVGRSPEASTLRNRGESIRRRGVAFSPRSH